MENMDLKEARRLVARANGLKNLKKHGKEFYKEISAKGVAARKAKKDKTTQTAQS